MPTIEQRRREFLEETIAFYSADPEGRRAITALEAEANVGCKGPRCRYRTEDGRKCAVGRHIPDDRYEEEMEGGYSASDARIFTSLPDDVRALGVYFIRQVQVLHDWDENWTDSGLSEEGQQRRDNILRNYCM